MIDERRIFLRLRAALGNLRGRRAAVLEVSLRGEPVTAWQSLVRWTNPIREFADVPDVGCLRRAHTGLVCAIVVVILTVLSELTALACLVWHWCE